jgi:hypothetical protein
VSDRSDAEAAAPGAAARRDLRRASWLLAAIVVAATAYHWHCGGGWNVMTRLALVRAVVYRHVLVITPSQFLTGDRAEYPPGSGVYYSDKPVGAQVLGVLGYVVGLRAAMIAQVDPGAARATADSAATWAASGLPTIALALALLRLLVAMGHSVRRSAFIALAVICGTLLWPYATLFYGHQASAAFALVGFRFAFAAARGRSPMVSAILAGLFCAWAAISELPAAFIALVVFVYLALAGWRLVVAAVVGALPPLALQLACNQACFGSPLRFGYMYEVMPEFRNPAGWVSYPRLGPLLAITFSLDKGLFFMSPFLLFAAWGLYLALRTGRWRREAAVCAVVAVGFLLYNAGHYLWSGGSCFGPRHLVSMLPFLGVGLAWAWQRMGPSARRVCLLLIAWGVLVSFAAVCTSPDATPLLLTGSYGPGEVLSRLALARLEWEDLGMWLGLSPGLSIVVYAALLAVLVTALWAALPRRPTPDPAPAAPGHGDPAPQSLSLRL